MRLLKSCTVTAFALALSGCVVLDTAPPEAVGPGPFLTGNFNSPSTTPAAAAAPAPTPAPDLGRQLSGRTLTSPQMTDRRLVFAPNGTYFFRFNTGETLEIGRWYANGQQFCSEELNSNAFRCGTGVISGSNLRLTYPNGQTTSLTIS